MYLKVMIKAVNVCLILFFNNFKYGSYDFCEKAQKSQVVRTSAANCWPLPSVHQISSQLPFDVLLPCSLLWYWSLLLSQVLSACSRSPTPLLNIPFALLHPFSPVLRLSKNHYNSPWPTFNALQPNFTAPSRLQMLPQSQLLLFHPLCLQLAQAVHS